MKSSTQVRRSFLDFFAERGHRIVPSAPVYPQDDPTLLFTNAGMNQFKDVFLGTGRRDYTRAVDTQKCIRVSGKHNDLEEVGVDTYHHTFFEMLGNWSFGDYFKEEAIPWAWELLTEVWKLPKERLWVTVFEGDAQDGLPRDEDSARIWRETTDVAADHVLFFGRKANFWEMGETGPCGPCTEIHIDRGGPETDPRDGANASLGVNAGNERFLELWNNVFMEFNRLEGGNLVPLPARHVDTGMGFERIVGVLQGKRSNYDTDVFEPIFRLVEDLVGRPYGSGTSEADVAFRVIADHVRAVTSAFADGALPSNLGRGYVLRRLIRRASRYGRQALDQEEPFLFRVVPAVAETLGQVFPEIAQRVEHVQTLLEAEEAAFGKTLGRGLVRFEELAKKTKGGRLGGAESFDLYATYGFPKDLVELMARERKLSFDEEGWTRAEKEHQAASRSEGKFKQLILPEQLEKVPPTRSTFYDEGERAYCLDTEVVNYGVTSDGRYFLILRESPFYPEAGGQVGDRGSIRAADGTWKFLVENTYKVGGIVLHVGPTAHEPDFCAGPVIATVDREPRDRTRKNHTATHLLHKALKEVLGEHVVQQGSYVGPDRLRFDFLHSRGLTSEEVEEVERRVNDAVFTNSPVRTTDEDLAAAKARGVVALFGEKYDERVRVVDVGGWSTELCGGTHVRAAGDIGPFVIVSEGAIQAGVRRIEALTGPEAVAAIQRQRRVLRESSALLKTGERDLPARIQALQESVKELKRGQQKSKADFGKLVQDLVQGAERVGESLVIAEQLEGVDGSELSKLIPLLQTSGKSICGVLGLVAEEKPVLSVFASKDLGGERVDSAAIVNELAPLIGGRGGGSATLARAGGKTADQLGAAIAKGGELLRSALTAG